MTILNMAWWWGNNINVPLNWISNLTATSWNWQSVIKRTDVWDLVVNWVTVNEWSCTKLVRKTGSAPASSNDWTPVLTETLENAYSVTGYTNTGLTNGTTYYYWAFSVGTNGLETISNIATVTPSASWWQPWANTIVYYPLDSTNTVNDLSWNWYNLTNAWWVTFGTNEWVDCAYFNGSYLYYSSLSTIPQWNAVRTVSYYVYCQQTDKQHFQRWNSGNDYAFWTFMGGNHHLYISTYLWLSIEWTVDMTNAWHYVTITHDWATAKLYIDWQLDSSANWTLNTNWTDFYIWHCTWVSWDFDKYISNFIVENKVRTAQEVQLYYNQTKANYWI